MKLTLTNQSVAPVQGDIRGVIFDLDGTLYTARFLGLTIAMGLLFELSLLRTLFTVRKIERGKEYPDIDAFKRGFAETFSELTDAPPGRLLDWYESRFMERFTVAIQRRGRRRTGVRALLGQLKQNGIKTAVVSDFGRVPERLEAIGLSPSYFDTTAAAEAFGVMKPSARPFVQIAETWGIPIDNTLLVGDRQDHDEESAVLAGAKFIGIAGGKQAGADFLEWADAVRRLEQLAVRHHSS